MCTPIYKYMKYASKNMKKKEEKERSEIVDRLKKVAEKGGDITVDSDKDYDERMEERLE